MTHYLLSIQQPDGPPPPNVDLTTIMRDVSALNDEMKAANAWVFGDGLAPPETATVVRVREGQPLLTDGPYIESTEHIGGLCIVRAANLDDALRWGQKLAAATTLPVEVRPFQTHGLP